MSPTGIPPFSCQKPTTALLDVTLKSDTQILPG